VQTASNAPQNMEYTILHAFTINKLFSSLLPIPTHMMRLPYNVGPVSQTNGRATQVQRTHFSQQKQKIKNKWQGKELAKVILPQHSNKTHLPLISSCLLPIS
jgi:hypothetical protein